MEPPARREAEGGTGHGPRPVEARGVLRTEHGPELAVRLAELTRRVERDRARVPRAQDAPAEPVALERLERALGEEPTLDGPSVVRPAQRLADFDPRAQVLGRVERAERRPRGAEFRRRLVLSPDEEPPVPEDEMGEGAELRARQDGLGFPDRHVAPRDRRGEIRKTLGRIGRSRLFEDMGCRETARGVVEIQRLRRLGSIRLERGKDPLLLAREAPERRRHRLHGRAPGGIHGPRSRSPDEGVVGRKGERIACCRQALVEAFRRLALFAARTAARRHAA